MKHSRSKLFEVFIRAGIIIFICLIMGGILSLFSPSVTLEFDTYERLEFWIILCLIGGIGILICDILFDYFSDALPMGLKPVGLKPLAQSICGTVAVLIPVHMIYEPQELPNILTRVVFVWVIMAMIVAGAFIINRQVSLYKAADLNTETASEEIKPPKILSRLPVHLQQAELYALSAEDHYVRVHTSKGEDLVLIRLSDAIAETGDLTGLQTHRSWWIAKSAVTDLKVKNRTGEITLKNGTQALVSRNGLKRLKQFGWM